MKNIFFSLLFITSLTSNAQERKLQVDGNHSTIGFSISIAGFSEVTGKFTDFQVYVDWDDSQLLATNIEATIQATSINTGIPDRDAHLRTADFFEVEKYPTITFKSDSIKRVNFSHFKAYGTFTMHGVAKKVVLPFKIVKQDGNTIGFKCRTTLNRLDYNVASDFKHTSVPGFLSEEIDIQIDFSTRKRKE